MQFGRWTLDEEGWLALDVWRVHDLSTAETGVIKRARKGKDGRARFAYEIQVLASLQAQEGVLRLLDHDPSINPAWMVTEEATPLAEHLGAIPDLHSVVAAVKGIAEAMVAAKAIGVAHRDIKPDNLFYVRGRGVLGDFGLATGHQSDRRRRSCCAPTKNPNARP